MPTFTECVNSLASRFGKQFLWKFLLQFSSCLAAQRLSQAGGPSYWRTLFGCDLRHGPGKLRVKYPRSVLCCKRNKKCGRCFSLGFSWPSNKTIFSELIRVSDFSWCDGEREREREGRGGLRESSIQLNPVFGLRGTSSFCLFLNFSVKSKTWLFPIIAVNLMCRKCRAMAIGDDNGRRYCYVKQKLNLPINK